MLAYVFLTKLWGDQVLHVSTLWGTESRMDGSKNGTPDKETKKAVWYWWKGCCLSISNKAKSKKCFAVTSAKKVAVFWASLKLVTEEPGA